MRIGPRLGRNAAAEQMSFPASKGFPAPEKPRKEKPAIVHGNLPNFAQFVKRQGGLRKLIDQMGDAWQHFAESVGMDHPNLGDLPEAQQNKLVLEAARREFEERYDEIIGTHELHNFPLELYREVSLPDGIDSLKLQGIGNCWSWEESAAQAHWGTGHGDEDYMLRAEVSESAVDWDMTLFLNLDPSTGDDEKEIRLQEGARIEFTGWKDDSGQWQTPKQRIVTAANADAPVPETSAFKGWFRDSKVVDDKGNSGEFDPNDHSITARETKTALDVKETPSTQRYRERGGYSRKVEIDAAKFKALWEAQHPGETLDWNPQRLERLKPLEFVDAHPLVYSDWRGLLDVTDGRHRISEAARRGEPIWVAISDSVILPDSILATANGNSITAGLKTASEVCNLTTPEGYVSGQMYSADEIQEALDIQTPYAKVVLLSHIEVLNWNLGKGFGSSILKEFLAKAAHEGAGACILWPYAMGAMAQEDLVAWYKRHGFVKSENFPSMLEKRLDPSARSIVAIGPRLGRSVTASASLQFGLTHRAGGFDVAAFDMDSDDEDGVPRVGFLQIDCPRPGIAVVQAVDVDENYQRQGISRKLYQMAKDELKARGVHLLKGALEGSGPLQVREQVFGPGNTRYLVGGEEVPVAEARKIMDVDYGRLIAETKIAAVEAPAPSVTETAAFQAWFGDSKVVDAEGQPLIVHHQTHNDIEIFDRMWAANRFGRDPEGIDTVGIWFTEAQDKRHYGPKNVDAYLSIQRPFVLQDYPDGVAWLQLMDMVYPDNKGVPKRLGELEQAKSGRHGATVLRDDLKANGYDGLCLLNTELDGRRQTVWLALEPNQVKSASRNSGQFDPNNHSIIAAVALKYKSIKNAPTDQLPEDMRREAEHTIPDDWGNNDGEAEFVWSFRNVPMTRFEEEDLLGDYENDAEAMEHINELAADVKRNGFTQPIVLGPGGREGNHRLAVAQLLGLKTIPAIVSHKLPRVKEAAVAAPTQPITETPAFKKWFGNSLVKDAQGHPLVVYRGEHGEYQADRDFHSRHPAISFGGPATATLYAEQPNYRDDHAVNPRVYPCYLRIEKPIVNDDSDPFIDFSIIAEALGDDVARRFALKHQEGITDTGRWMEELSETYKSVEQMLTRDPHMLREVYMMAFPLLDDGEFIQALQAKGYDGAIHGPYGEGDHDEAEYKIFDASQAKSAIGNNGEFDLKNKSITAAADTPAITETPAFRSWFQGSKVVDAQGNPLVVYHGTSARFDTFEFGDIGFHVGTQGQAHARENAPDKTPGGDWNVMPLYASIKHPLRTKDAGNWNSFHDTLWAVNQAVGGKLGHLEETLRAELSTSLKGIPAGSLSKDTSYQVNKPLLHRIQQELIQLGYDGIVYGNDFEDEESDGESWIAFSSNQIKSAIANSGQYDSAKPGITAKLLTHHAGSALLQTLEQGRAEIARLAQQEYDAWAQDEEGYDEELGAGGICDAVANAIGGWLAGQGIDSTEGGQDGDDHAFQIAYNDTEAYEVDIPPSVYETGGGYRWTKRPDVTIAPEDVIVYKIHRADLGGGGDMDEQ
jgi:GNAT superfamily N-acetyltransferase